MFKTAVVVLHYGSIDDTKECIVSLLKGKNAKSTDIIVVANSYSSSFLNDLTTLQSNITVLETGENRGFAGGVNAGIRRALDKNASYIIVLNNDTIVTNDLVARMCLFAQKHGDAGLISPKVYFAKGMEYHKQRYKDSERGSVIWYAGGRIDWNNVYATHRGVDEVDYGQFNETSETDFATGCCMLIRREVIEKVGLLDERYFLYFEDVDYSYRVKQAGYKVMYYHDAHLWHKNAASSGKPGSKLHSYYQTRNRFYFGIRYAPWRTKKSLIMDSFRLLFRGGEFSRGVVDFYLGKMGKQ